MYIFVSKPIIHSALRISRPKNLIEARIIETMTERNFISQQKVVFDSLRKETTYNDNKYPDSRKGKMKESNYHRCGKNWIPSHRCEDMSLHYYKIVNGNHVEVTNA